MALLERSTARVQTALLTVRSLRLIGHAMCFITTISRPLAFFEFSVITTVLLASVCHYGMLVVCVVHRGQFCKSYQDDDCCVLWWC